MLYDKIISWNSKYLINLFNYYNLKAYVIFTQIIKLNVQMLLYEIMS